MRNSNILLARHYKTHIISSVCQLPVGVYNGATNWSGKFETIFYLSYSCDSYELILNAKANILNKQCTVNYVENP